MKLLQNYKEKKMWKKEMENDNVVMCQLEEEGSNGKQQCGDVLFATEETKGNTEEIGTTSSPHHPH